MEHQHQVPNRTRTYVLTFAILFVLTLIEFAAASLPSPFKLPVLLSLATTKAIFVAGIYMHLRFDHRVFLTLVLMGLFFAMIMILLFTVLLGIHWDT